MLPGVRMQSARAVMAGLATVLLVGPPPLAASDPPESEFTAAERSHWAFQPIRRPALPRVENTSLVRTPVDAFLLARLEARGLTFSPEADRPSLIRRLKFDLLGLPPTPEEVEEFVADARPDAFERLVDRFLASPHYGESWGRMWLDVVRYADTAGYNADPLRPLAWQYRDYIIRSFNEDKPLDRFLEEQIAGDELHPEDRDALIATGYLRMWPDESNASNVLLARQDALNDLTGNFGAAFLGLSLACAQCHDHKFDPLRQRDYYALQAFFAGITPVDAVPRGSPAELAEYRRRHREWLDASEPVREEVRVIEAAARIPLTAEKRMKFPAVVLEAIDTHPERRSTYQRQLVFWAERQIVYKEADLVGKLTDEQKARRDELKLRLEELKQTAPQPPSQVAALSVAELSGDVPRAFLLDAGSYDRPDEELQPAFLGVLFPPAASPDADIVAAKVGSSGRRTALARWLTSPQNPLTARVLANRIWQEHFGRGLIENANDFGTQTAPPSHPELLDWLAAELLEGELAGERAARWSGMKRLHRTIVLSAAYRQATRRTINEGPEARASARSSEADPDNTLYWHFPRRRLSAERVRDALLAVSRQLDTSMEGAGVCPPLPPGYNTREAWKVSENPRDHARRSIYILAKRNLPFPLLAAFDLPDMHESCARRANTTTAPQALMLLNGDVTRSAAESIAARILDDRSTDEPASLVAAAWRIILTREAESDEIEAGLRFLKAQSRRADESWNERPGPAVAEIEGESLGVAVADLCHVLLNSNEFLYLD